MGWCFYILTYHFVSCQLREYGYYSVVNFFPLSFKYVCMCRYESSYCVRTALSLFQVTFAVQSSLQLYVVQEGKGYCFDHSCFLFRMVVFSFVCFCIFFVFLC